MPEAASASLVTPARARPAMPSRPEAASAMLIRLRSIGILRTAPTACCLALCGGSAIMPGLVEAHFHPTYFNVAALEDLDIKYPVEYVTLLAAAKSSAGGPPMKMAASSGRPMRRAFSHWIARC